MNTLRSILLGTVVLAGAGPGFIAPTEAASGGVYAGPDRARVYVDERGRHHGDYYRRGSYNDGVSYRAYTRSSFRFRPCHNNVSVEWRAGYRVRVVDRICYNRLGHYYVASREYYRIGW